MEYIVHDRFLMQCIPAEGDTEIIVPDGVIGFGKHVFDNCESIRRIVIPSSVDFVGQRMIWLPSIEEVVLLGKYHAIHEEAFPYNAHKLRIVMGTEGLSRFTEIHKRAALRGYLHSRGDGYSEKSVAAHNQYLIDNAIKFLPMILLFDLVYGLEIIDEYGRIDSAKFYKSFLDAAIEAGATICVDFLKAWEFKNMSQKQIENHTRCGFYSEKTMKNFWDYEICEDGTVSLTNYKGLARKLVVPSQIGNRKVSKIGDYCFSIEFKKGFRREFFAELLDEIVFSGSITEIGFRAFYESNNLKTIDFSNGVYVLGSELFYIGNKIEKIILPDKIDNVPEGVVPTIKSQAFNYVKIGERWRIPDGFVNVYSIPEDLLEIYIPKSVEDVCFVNRGGDDTFGQKNTLESVIIDEENKHLRVVQSCVINDVKHELVYGFKNPTIPTDCNLLSIGNYAFQNCKAFSATELPSGIKSIGAFAFFGCNNITQFFIPNSVAVIGRHAFATCHNMKKIRLPDKMERIADSAFEYSGLEKVHIPRGLESIEFATFFGCRLSDVIIPDGVESIAANAFGYMHLNNVYFPESVKWIETSERWPSFWHGQGLSNTTFHVYKGSYMEQVGKKERFIIKYR